MEVEAAWHGYRPKTSRGGRRRKEIRWALRDVTFSVAAGEMFGIIGRNGSGKSTMLQCIAGVLRPVRGKVTTSGRSSMLVDLTAGFHRELTGRENVTVAGALNGLGRGELRDRYERMVEFAQLTEDVMNAPLRTYSSGMMLRLGFSILVHTDPSVLLVDEVLAVGDEEFQKACLARIDYLRERGCGVVVVSHNLDLIRERCDRAGLLADGEMLFQGESSEAVSAYHDLTGGRPDQQDLSPAALFAGGPRIRKRRRSL
ncbi:MAG: ABC transporter ATP-binding protein [Actinomycetota bacterium]